MTRALRNAVRDGRVAHAYLFSGPRGTGKTSTARILAMALNCAHPVEGEPDGTCSSCVEIRRGASVDVQELDAASNRRIDEMRDLLARVALGARGRWKVYIIDEVHQLTADAASALLKTLEEPPPHVVFVLATTDPQKVLPTIRSRTLHFEFHLLGADVLGELLRNVNDQAALGVAPERIDLVVRRGHGSARDALTVLDQVAAAANEVEDEASIVAEIVDGVADADPGRVLLSVAEGMSAGRDARRLAADVLDHLRNGFLATMARGLVMLPDDAQARVEEQARRLGPVALVRAMEVVGQALTDMRDSVDPRVTLEVALVRLARPEVDTSVAALVERVARLERMIAGSPDRALVGRASPERASSEQARAERAPAERGAVDRGPGDQRPADQRPADQRPADWSPADHRPADRTSSGRAPADRTSPEEIHSDRADVPEPPGPPGAKQALGAIRRSTRPDPLATGPPAPSSPAPSSPAPSPPAPSPPAAARASAPPDPASPGEAPGGAPDEQGGVLGPLPSRDELTKVWGDTVLRKLSGRAKAYLGSGRFLEVDDRTAIFAVPDKHLMSRAETVRGEAEAALGRHFGRPVPLRLIVDQGGRPVDRAMPPSTSRDPAASPEAFEVDELTDAPSPVTSPEQRLLDAFPGAEEVST